MRLALPVALLSTLGLLAPACTTTTYRPTPTYVEPVAELGVFYDQLAPHGRWFWLDEYGWAWTPSVSAGWRPYTVGRWVYTDLGWTFVSPEPWSWAAYHYGRWVWLDGVWAWIPGDVWAPAWVRWRVAPGYIGWAPLPPDAWFSFGVGFGAYDYRLPAPYWVFVDDAYFLSPGLYRYAVPVRRNVVILDRTRDVTDYRVRDGRVIVRGVPPERVERATGRDVEERRIIDVRSREQARAAVEDRDEVPVYRPRGIEPERGERDVGVARTRPPELEPRVSPRVEERVERAPRRAPPARIPDVEARREAQERARERIELQPAPAPTPAPPVERPQPVAPEGRARPTPPPTVERPQPIAPEGRTRPTPPPAAERPAQRPVERPAPSPPPPRERPTPQAPTGKTRPSE